MLVTVRRITPEQTHAMRQRILRPHQAIEEMDYPGDGGDETVHLGAFDGGRLLGIASIYHEPWPRDPRPGDWRLRGMAVDENWRSGGAGAALLRACGEQIALRGGTRLWCYARTPACGFYEKFGLSVRSEVWDGGDIGPHVDMAGDISDLLSRSTAEARETRSPQD